MTQPVIPQHSRKRSNSTAIDKLHGSASNSAFRRKLRSLFMSVFSITYDQLM